MIAPLEWRGPMRETAVIRKLVAAIAVLAVTGCSELPPPPPTPIGDPGSFMVFFDWDRSSLSQQGLQTIEAAADLFKKVSTARVTAVGHTDRSGPESYNLTLSLRRAAVVKEALVRDGVPESAITIVGKGETQPLVSTPDGVREPQNRRVEIVMQ
jgi:OmpA-OmpF porin, OOP family